MIDAGQLRQIMPTCPQARADLFIAPLQAAMAESQIDESNARIAAFIAQVAHESCELRYMRELADGREYENQRDLGNLYPGDGPKFKGRGPIEITGRDNYRYCSAYLYGDERLLDTPELLEQPEDGCRGSAWFWLSKGLNALADQGDFFRISARINGINRQTGEPNGMPSRLTYWERAKVALGLT